MTTLTPHMLVPLTTSQRHALHDAATRRASLTRRAARKAAHHPHLPDTEQAVLNAEASTAHVLADITGQVEALVIRRTDHTPPPRNLTEIIIGEGLALLDAINAGDMDDVALTLATLNELVRHTQRDLLDDDTIDTVAPNMWASNGRLVWPSHCRYDRRELELPGNRIHYTENR